MVTCAAKRSGSSFVIGRAAWKSIAVSKLMYGTGALGLYQAEYCGMRWVDGSVE